jgi:hypothetical protein
VAGGDDTTRPRRKGNSNGIFDLHAKKRCKCKKYLFAFFSQFSQIAQKNVLYFRFKVRARLKSQLMAKM